MTTHKDTILQILGIKKQYVAENKKAIDALKGVTLDINRGEILSLLGVNGAGKSTLSSIIATLIPPSDGEILFKGTSIYTDIINYRMHLGFCPQKPNLDTSISLETNLRFAGRFYGMSEAAIDERLHVVVDQLELGEYLDCKATVLSGGYKQRFMIARSIMHNPDILLLDEPTVGLDPHIRRQLWDIMKSLNKTGVTILLTTHYLDEAEKLSDRVCVLDHGLIKLVDTPEKLLSDFKKENLEDVFLALLEENRCLPC